MPTDIQEQIERRRQRAQEEILKVSNKGSHPLFSPFEVRSVSGRSYRVEIRSLDQLQNTCTCPDYRTNLIGTCKHEEMLRPIRDALGWGLSSLLALQHDFDPSADLPAPRRIQSDLVEPAHLPDELAARLARVRELTAPAEPGDEAPPLSVQTGESLANAVRDLLDLARQQVVRAGM